MKYALSFLLGAVRGSSVALLSAPASGEELRTNIKTQANTQYARLQADYNKGIQEMHDRLNKISSQLQVKASRS